MTNVEYGRNPLKKMKSFTFTEMDTSMAECVSALTCRVFDRFIAPLFNADGVEEFKRYASAAEIRKRRKEGYVTLLARRENQPAGIIEIRPPNHISLFFVTAEDQGKGIGRALFEQALHRVRRENPSTSFITVNASPNALHIYERLGFEKTTSGVLEVDGIRFYPLRRPHATD